METKETYFKRQHVVRELLDLLLVDENASEKEKLKSVQETTIFYLYYALILDESHTDFKKLKKIRDKSMNPLERLNLKNKKEGADLYDTFQTCLQGVEILYEAILSDEVDDERKKDYDKLARSFFKKMDELCCYVLRNWKIIE